MTNAAAADFLSGLTAGQVALVRRVGNFLRLKVAETINQQSTLVTNAFAEEFRNRLLLYHALNDEPLKKKTFEFSFAAACRAAGSAALVTTSSTHAGRDVEIDGVAFSCKTEASADVRPRSITISKLMEARWIRECVTSQDYASMVRQRVARHLGEYERIIMLRALRAGGGSFTYQLVEIPRSILLLAGDLEAKDFSTKTRNNSSRAEVMHNQ